MPAGYVCNCGAGNAPIGQTGQGHHYLRRQTWTIKIYLQCEQKPEEQRGLELFVPGGQQNFEQAGSAWGELNHSGEWVFYYNLALREWKHVSLCKVTSAGTRLCSLGRSALKEKSCIKMFHVLRTEAAVKHLSLLNRLRGSVDPRYYYFFF